MSEATGRPTFQSLVAEVRRYQRQNEEQRAGVENQQDLHQEQVEVEERRPGTENQQDPE